MYWEKGNTNKTREDNNHKHRTAHKIAELI